MRERPAVSIVIPAWNAWETTRSCLDSLYLTLAASDEVVVVDDGSTDATPSHLAHYGWARVIRNPTNLGFAAACNRGAAAAPGEILVFLNNDTLLFGRWIDALTKPFANPEIGGVGPRSNFVSGPQLVPEAQTLPPEPSRIRSFARTWQNAHRGETSPTDRLVGFCLAIRRNAFEEVGGFDESYGNGGFEDDDLCLRLIDGSWKLAISHECFVYHRGHVTFHANGLDWYAEQQRNEGRFIARHHGTRSREVDAG